MTNRHVLEQVVQRARQHIGEKRVTFLGEISSTMIQRFARAIGATNPIYFDEQHAMQLGYRGLPAPAVMLTAIRVWGPGPEESDLHIDGTVRDDWLNTDGVRRMGGGQSLEFHSPVVAGDRITVTRRLESVTMKEGRSGPLAFLEYVDEFSNQDDLLLVTCRETMILR